MPVRYPRVLIVDAPSSVRTVIYDFNDNTQSLDGGSKTELSAAQWEFGSIDLLGDPDAIGVEYSLQRITFQQTVTGSKPAAMGRLVQHSRALSQRRFWLEFQLTAGTAPVWWHAYRSAPSDLSIENVYVDETGPRDRWELNGGIDVDAFSYSERITLPTVTVGNDPANDPTAPSSGYNLPTIKGDAPTKLRLSLTSSATSTFSQRWLVACVSSSRPAPVIRVPIGTGDGFTAGTGTASGSSVSGAVGGSARVVTIDPNESDAVRLTGMLPASSAPPGRYAVYLRCSGRFASGATGGFTIAAQLTLPSGPVVTDAYRVGSPQLLQFYGAASGPNLWQYAPLGVIGIGDGTPAGVPAPMRRTVSLAMKPTNLVVAQVAVTVDEFLLVPVSGEGVSSVTSGVFSTAGMVPTSANPLTIDAETETAALGATDPSMYSTLTSGTYPAVDPGAAYNTLLVLPMDDPGGPGDSNSTTRSTDLARTATVSVSYHPRSAWLGDGT